MDRPHILIIMTDQHRPDCLSLAGHPIVRTPNLDRLAERGTSFSRAYTTCPMCLPARSSFMTGLYCHNHGHWGNYGHLRSDLPTYAKSLRQEGYRTCHIGKSHFYPYRRDTLLEVARIRHLNDARPYMHRLGWDEVWDTPGSRAWPWMGCSDSIVSDYWQEKGLLEVYAEDSKKRKDVGVGSSALDTWPSPMPPGEHLDDFVGRRAVEYLEGLSPQMPHLVFVGFPGPHQPWDAPAEWAARYDPLEMDSQKPVCAPGKWVPSYAAEHQRRLQNDDLGFTDELNGKIRSLYYAKISHIDSWVGRMMEVMERRGILDDTVVVFWSDHGEMLCDKGRVGKAVFYEPSVRVPLLVSGRGRAKRCEELVSIVDVYPTLLELAGCTDEWRGFGRSLLPLVDEESDTHRDAVFSEIGDTAMAFDGRHKLVVDKRGRPLELYDLADDPAEDTNLVGRRELDGVVRELSEGMLGWYVETQQKATN